MLSTGGGGLEGRGGGGLFGRGGGLAGGEGGGIYILLLYQGINLYYLLR